MQEVVRIEPAEPVTDEGRLWPGGFHVDSQQAAEWVIDKMIALEERAERLDAQYKAMKAAIIRDRESLDRRFSSELRAWASENMPVKSKTLHLLTGSVSFRTVRGGPRIADSREVEAWARENLPEAVIEKIDYKIDAQMIKNHVQAWGEIPPGVEIADDREEMYVKPARGDA
jgi:phage host-nuclease inhibitor protein Gam